MSKKLQRKEEFVNFLNTLPSSLLCFTDGSSLGNPGPAGAGVHVTFYNADQKKFTVVRDVSAPLGTATNNVAELTAFGMALDALVTIEEVQAIHAQKIEMKGMPWKEVHIFTDSRYVEGLLTKNWVPKMNQELIATIKKKLGTQRIRWVPAHIGIDGNERADQLANQAAKEQKAHTTEIRTISYLLPQVTEFSCINANLPYFAEMTRNQCVIMDRKTYESDKALPNRVNIVVANDCKITDPQTFLVNSFEEAWLKAVCQKRKVFVVGQLCQKVIDHPRCQTLFGTQDCSIPAHFTQVSSYGHKDAIHIIYKRL